MLDINGIELKVGDYALLAFSSCNTAHIEYVTIIEAPTNKNQVKVRFDTNYSSGFKTKTCNIYNSRFLKQERND